MRRRARLSARSLGTRSNLIRDVTLSRLAVSVIADRHVVAVFASAILAAPSIRSKQQTYTASIDEVCKSNVPGNTIAQKPAVSPPLPKRSH